MAFNGLRGNQKHFFLKDHYHLDLMAAVLVLLVFSVECFENK